MSKSAVDLLFDGADWETIPQSEDREQDGLPFATHRGVLRLGALELIVFQLNDGRRLVSEESMAPLLSGLDLLEDNGPCDFYALGDHAGWICGTCDKKVLGSITIADACERLRGAEGASPSTAQKTDVVAGSGSGGGTGQ